MSLLILTSCLWAFSFGIIGTRFGGVDPFLLAFLRLALALLVFAPLAVRRGPRLAAGTRLALVATGAVQYGLMYALLFSAFAYVGGRSYLIALFTITTPIMVLLVAQAMEGQLRWRSWTAAALAVAGAVVIQLRADVGSDFWTAFALLQGSNACFAVGQVAYRRVHKTLPRGTSAHHVYAWVFLGAAALAGLWAAARQPWAQLGTLTPPQWLALVYLGTVASGLGFFWWNLGGTRVSAATLAVLNNLKVPLAVVVSLIAFQEWRGVTWPQLAAGSLLLGAALVLAHVQAHDH